MGSFIVKFRFGLSVQVTTRFGFSVGTFVKALNGNTWAYSNWKTENRCLTGQQESPVGLVVKALARNQETVISSPALDT